VAVGKVKIPTYWYGEHPNFGDALTAHIFPRYGISVSSCTVEKAELIGIGSLLGNLVKADTKAIILGAGFMFRRQAFSLPRKQVAAVRGKLSAERLGLSLGKVPLGDPGILIEPLAGIVEQHQIGIVPHYVDKGAAVLELLKEKHGEAISIIDVEHNDIDRFVRDMSACNTILSSSLHGLIAAWALGKPGGRLGLSDRVVGKGFKFDDFYSAFGLENAASVLDGSESISSLQDKCLAPPLTIPRVQADLIEAFDQTRRKLISFRRKLTHYFSGFRAMGE